MKRHLRTFLNVQWLRLPTSTAGGVGLIPGWGTKIPHAVSRQNKFKEKKKRHLKKKKGMGQFLAMILRVCSNME